MKFASDQDAKLFLIEIGNLDSLDSVTKDLVPSEEMMVEFIKKRRSIIGSLKNFRRKQNTKQQWRSDRYKMLKGIKRFHKSTAGKKFHRSLGKFIATRESLEVCSERVFYLSEITEVLKAISSLKTHAFIELEYFHPLSEELEYRIFFEELLPVLDSIEKKILSGDFSLTDDENEFLLRIVDFDQIKKSLSEFYGVDLGIIDEIHTNAFKQNLQNMSEEDYRYFTKSYMLLLTGIKKSK